jgi:sarcosine oxidase subunit delta
MRIDCPLCGQRPLEEFQYGGDASRRRPRGDASAEEWFSYVYLRANLCGPMREHWRHGGGCGAWLLVERDSATHDVLLVRLAVGTDA